MFFVESEVATEAEAASGGGDGGECAPCTLGRFSSFRPGNGSRILPRNCTLCPSGTYANVAGASECAECPVGKLSSEDRTHCA